jgi:hypothetical protein
VSFYLLLEIKRIEKNQKTLIIEMFVYHFIFRGFMFTTQKKFKASLLATVFAFAMVQPVHAVVVSYNPFFCLAGVGVGSALLGALLDPSDLPMLIEEKAIDTWIAKNNLNKFGEPKETVYANAVTGPLRDDQSRISYIKAKFNDEDIKPWRSGFTRMLDKANHLKLASFGMIFGGASIAYFALVIGAATSFHSY